MPPVRWRGREAFELDNGVLRLVALRHGGHIAEITHKAAGVNPLWVTPWPSIEPHAYNEARHPEYGRNAESKLLAGISGHNLCLDIFGAPTSEEAAAGITVHGEASVASYKVAESSGSLRMSAHLPLHGLAFERSLRLEGESVLFQESVENLTATDRPIAWTQHVTLGPPFLERGLTEFRATATRSMTYPSEFAGPGAYLPTAASFDWPMAPRKDGRGHVDMRRLQNVPASAGFTTHLMDPRREKAWFVAFSPTHKLLFGYEWWRKDFPWLGIWEENNSRTAPPWNGRTLTRGMEFGASPFPESRRAMIDRRELFGTPAYRWLPAKSKIKLDYRAFAQRTQAIPQEFA
jgi:hypothetical protein